PLVQQRDCRQIARRWCLEECALALFLYPGALDRCRSRSRGDGRRHPLPVLLDVNIQRLLSCLQDLPRPLFFLARLHPVAKARAQARSEEHTSELQSRENLVCRLLLENNNNNERHTAATHATT